MNIKKLLAEAIQKLKKNKIKFPHLEAEILLSHILKKPREYLFAHPEAKLTKKQVSVFSFQVAERIKGKPIAYIIGEKEFYGLKFFVDKNVLIPRPETEMMVEEATMLAKTISTPITFIDVGTGSGCIVITLMKSLANFGFSIFDFRFYAIDVSNKSLDIARKNAKLHSVSKHIYFLKSNLLTSFPKSKIQNPQSKIFLANLPYLTPAQIRKAPSIRFEPRLALAAGPDGLKYYRRLFGQIGRARLKNVTILCEIDPSQKVSIKRLSKIILPTSSLEIKKDLRGHSRLAIIRIA